MPMNYMKPEAFRDLAKSGDVPDVMLLRGMEAPPEQITEETRTARFVFSDARVDLMGDTINQMGWDLSGFTGGNPVALWAHDASQLPIGKALNVYVRNNSQLVGEINFVPKETSRFADTVYQMVKGGYLNAVSVGFAPTEWKFAEQKERQGGIDFLKQKLLEISVVPLPANPGALVEARSAGIDIEPVREWALKLLETQNIATISRDRLKQIEGLATEFRSIAGKLPKHAAGASGIWRRAANTVERVLGGSVPAPEPETAKPAGTPALDAARRRMAAIRARLT
jgi:HK97 family phage prohead protease